MPSFTITLSDGAVTRLQQIVAADNQASGANLTVKQWIKKMLKERSVSAEMGAKYKELEKAGRTKLQSDIEAERIRLMGEVE